MIFRPWNTYLEREKEKLRKIYKHKKEIRETILNSIMVEEEEKFRNEIHAAQFLLGGHNFLPFIWFFKQKLWY